MNPDFYAIINEFRSNRNGLTVLDVGCAEIRPYSEYLIEISNKYTGIDKSQTLINKAKLKLSGEKYNLLLGEIEEIDLEKESFDIIVCNNMLAYTNQEKVLEKLYELLKPSGLFISYNNNTIAYSLYKIAKPYKIWYKEWLHSLLVIVNTLIFRGFKTKIFRTVYNTENSLLKVLNRYNYKKFKIETVKGDLPYEVINFFYVK